MDRTLVDFIKALRGAGVRTSTAETLDAVAAVQLVGYSNRDYLKFALGTTLAKSEDDQQKFSVCFDQFFPSTAWINSARKSRPHRRTNPPSAV